MNTQHTPGPWRYARGNGSPTTGEHMIAGATPGYLAEVRDVGSGSVVANARLIAAAPELLAALKNAVRILTFAINNHQLSGQNKLDVAGHISAMRAAIAKAKGEET